MSTLHCEGTATNSFKKFGHQDSIEKCQFGQMSQESYGVDAVWMQEIKPIGPQGNPVSPEGLTKQLSTSRFQNNKFHTHRLIIISGDFLAHLMSTQWFEETPQVGSSFKHLQWNLILLQVANRPTWSFGCASKLLCFNKGFLDQTALFWRTCFANTASKRSAWKKVLNTDMNQLRHPTPNLGRDRLVNHSCWGSFIIPSLSTGETSEGHWTDHNSCKRS